MIIKGGQALVFSGEARPFRRADLRIEGERIAEIAPELAPSPREEVLDATGKLVLPGLVNAHYHSYSNFLKGTAWGEPLELWALDTVALGKRMNEETMRLSARLGIREMLRAGVTACLDHIPHLDKVDAIADEYAKTGFRATIAPMIADISDDEILPGVADKGLFPSMARIRPEEMTARYDGWAAKWHRPEGTLRCMVGVNSPQRASMTALETAREISERLDVGAHMHVLETRWQADAAKEAKESVVEKIRRAGLLNERASLAHCVWLTEAEKDLLADAHCTIVHNPTSNLLLGSGKADITGLARRGVPIALGSDGSNCATGQNMLGVLRTAILLSRLDEPDYPRWFRPEEAVRFVTENAAAAIGWGGVTGRLSPGKRADVVLANAHTVADTPCFDRLTQLLLLEDRIEATDVFVNGRRLMEHGRLLCMDEEALDREAEARLAALFHDMETVVRKPDDKKRIYAEVYEGRRIG